MPYDTPAGASQPPPSKRKAVRVRCLGPREKYHTFMSADPRRLRICPKCQRAQNVMHLAARHTEAPLSVPKD